MYHVPFRCNVTGATSTLPVAPAVPPVWCEGEPAACTKGAKQMLYWNQRDGNNIEVSGWDLSGGHKSPAYNAKCGFTDGAQNDIFLPSPAGSEGARRQAPALASKSAIASAIASSSAATAPNAGSSVAAGPTSPTLRSGSRAWHPSHLPIIPGGSCRRGTGCRGKRLDALPSVSSVKRISTAHRHRHNCHTF